MNGHVARSASLPNKAAGPAYSVLRDVNGLAALKQNSKQFNNVGRYTAVSKSVTKSNGSVRGVYHPNNTPLDASRRSQSQQQVEHTYMNNNYRNGINGNLHKSSIDFTTSTTHNGKLNGESEQQKAHCATSTLILRETGSRDPNYKSAGGSLSCGQPSPSSTAEESVVSALSPTSLRSEPRPQHQSYWLHQSEILLPTDRNPPSATGLLQLNELSNGRRGQSVTGLTNDERDLSTRNLASLDTSEGQYYSTSTMIYSGHQNSRDETDEYFNSAAGSSSTGPSHRKIQTLHGSGGSQRRYPSDTTLNFMSRDGTQVYTSGNKPGPVTIPARSRSAQPSPGPSPLASPTSFHRASESNVFQPYGWEDKQPQVKLQQSSGLQYTPIQHQQHRGRSSLPNLNRDRANSFDVNGHNDEIESPILPSVREIIRQVEAMTESNAATSTTDISNMGHGVASPSGIPRFQHQFSNSYQQPQQPRRNIATSFVRPVGSSQRTPSAPQLRSPPYTPAQAKFNAIASAAAASQNRNIAPPVPPHGTTRTSKTIIGAFTRRPEVNHNATSAPPQQQHTSVHKKTELLSQLPMDYQKLREAFIEQRREIQRLRKELADKDILLTQLQIDIRLYEPWR